MNKHSLRGHLRLASLDGELLRNGDARPLPSEAPFAVERKHLVERVVALASEKGLPLQKGAWPKLGRRKNDDEPS